jgi:hypothetical protein
MKASLKILGLFISIAGFFSTASAAGSALLNDRTAMYKFLNSNLHTEVQDKAAFLNAVPEFKNILTELSVANPQVAIDILKVLLSSGIYQSKVGLALLPAQQTSIVGPQADVQLAVTIDQKTVLSPEYKTLGDQQAYLLIHEALHSLVSDESAFHNHQVKNITNYLRKNRGAYKADELTNFVRKNFLRMEESNTLSALYFNRSASAELLCAGLTKEFAWKDLVAASRFFGLTCDFANHDADSFYLSYLNSRFKALGLEHKRFVATGYLEKIWNPIAPTSLYVSPKELNEWACHSTIRELPLREQSVVLIRRFVKIQNDYGQFFDSKKISIQDKTLIADFILGQNYDSESNLYKVAEYIQNANAEEAKVVAQYQQAVQYSAACKKQYGNYIQ